MRRAHKQEPGSQSSRLRVGTGKENWRRLSRAADRTSKVPNRLEMANKAGRVSRANRDVMGNRGSKANKVDRDKRDSRLVRGSKDSRARKGSRVNRVNKDKGARMVRKANNKPAPRTRINREAAGIEVAISARHATFLIKLVARTTAVGAAGPCEERSTANGLSD